MALHTHPLAVLFESLLEQLLALLLRQLLVVALGAAGGLWGKALALQLLLDREVLCAGGRKCLPCRDSSHCDSAGVSVNAGRYACGRDGHGVRWQDCTKPSACAERGGRLASVQYFMRARCQFFTEHESRVGLSKP